MKETTGFFRRLRDITVQRERQEKSLLRRLRNRLLIGFLVTFPLVVTLFFLRFAYRVLDGWFHPISLRLLGFVIPGVGTTLALLGLFVVGILATNLVGGRLLDLLERTISHVPLLSPIYQGARQVTEVLQLRGSEQFRRVVLVPFPHPGVRSVGFVTREIPRTSAFHDEPSVLVFVPTTPNPTSGFLVSVPRSSTVPVDISIEEGVKLVISGGLLLPPSMVPPDAGAATQGEDPTVSVLD